MNEWLKVQFHSHTIYSKDSLNPVFGLVEAARAHGVDRLIITDHNSIRGALAAKLIDPERVIVGEEILTDGGELLAAFVTEEVPEGLPALEAIRRLREQGAFISVSHPFDFQRHGWRMDELLRIAPLVDAIEVFNARCAYNGINEQARLFAEKHDLAGTVGSDAHALMEVGTATLELPRFMNADDLRQVIRQGRQVVALSSPWVHLSSWYARFYKAFRPFHE